VIVRSAQALLQRVRTRLLDSPLIALRRPRARLRWSAVLVAVIVLCSAPALVAALPVSAPNRSVPQLLDLVRTSESVPFTGYAESRGTLNLPDISSLGNQVVGLLSDRSRLRVWHGGPDRFRVDRLTAGGEEDTYVFGSRTLTWDSGERRVIRQDSDPQLPVPKPPDVLPTGLGQQLVEAVPADGQGVRLGKDRRIAGRTGTELIWQPNDPRSLVGEVRMWVDVANGLPLRVQLRATNSDVLAFETSFLDLKFEPPDRANLRLDVRHTERVDVQDMLTTSEQDLRPLYRLPRTIDGLPQRSSARPFIATYGNGAALVALAALDDTTADSIRQQIDSPGRPPFKGSFGEGTLIEAPMLRVLIFSSGDRGYALAGTVTVEVLQQMALELVTNPPDRNRP
jgi:hypothetical protein